MSPLGIIIPMYGNVTSVWQSVINYHEEFPTVPMMMVINPYDGPGKEYNSTFASWVSTLQGDGIPVLGYVTTAYTALPLSGVEAQVSDYVSWYGIHSIFIDDVENVHGYEAYYTSLSEYAHSNGITYVLGNPGTNVTTSYIGIFDNIGTYENSGAPSVSLIQAYTRGGPASGYSFIAYNAPLQSQAYYDAMAQYVSWVYITNNPNAWTTLPSYFTQEMTELAAIT
jgi:Spherulation-specific family 4